MKFEIHGFDAMIYGAASTHNHKYRYSSSLVSIWFERVE